MPNTLAPFGFSPSGTNGPGTPNFRLSQRLIAPGNTGAIFRGDAVQPVVTTATGFIIQATAGSVTSAGVFWGCQYLSVSQGRTVYSPFWPGYDANPLVNVTAWVIDDPLSIFLVQAAGGPITLANLYQNAPISLTTAGNTATGQSGMALGTPAVTATLPFQIVGFVQDPATSNGSDITTAYNYVYVGFNQQVFRAGVLSIS